jgi:hypothetical protein
VNGGHAANADTEEIMMKKKENGITIMVGYALVAGHI